MKNFTGTIPDTGKQLPVDRADGLPLVSVIMPVFNSEKYLEETIDSVCLQTYRNLEIIIIDDGSTDGGPAIIGRKAAAHQNLRAIRQDNAGVSASRNRGIREARGDYIAFIDSDDIWDPVKIESQMSALRESGMETSYCGMRIHFEDTGAVINDNKSFVSGDILIPILKNAIWPIPSTWIFRRDIFERHGLWFDQDTSFAEDMELFIKVAALYPAWAVDRYYTTYRIRPNSLSGYDSRHWNEINVWDRLKQWLAGQPGRKDRDLAIRIIDEFRIPSVLIRCRYLDRKLGVAHDSLPVPPERLASIRLSSWRILRHCHNTLDAVRLIIMKWAAFSTLAFRMVRFASSIIYRK